MYSETLFHSFKKFTAFGNEVFATDFGIVQNILPGFTRTRIQRQSLEADAEYDIEVETGVNQYNTDLDNEDSTCQPDSVSLKFSLGESTSVLG